MHSRTGKSNKVEVAEALRATPAELDACHITNCSFYKVRTNPLCLTIAPKHAPVSLTSTNKSLAFESPQHVAAMFAVGWVEECTTLEIVAHVSLNRTTGWLHCAFSQR